MKRAPTPRVGRPPGRTYSARLPEIRLRPEEEEVLREAADGAGISLSELVRVACRRYIAELRRRGTIE